MMVTARVVCADCGCFFVPELDEKVCPHRVKGVVKKRFSLVDDPESIESVTKLVLRRAEKLRRGS